MKTLLFLTCAFGLALAGPVAIDTVEKRAPPGKCGPRQYTQEEAQNAYGDALAILQRTPFSPIMGSNGRDYPGYYGNSDGLSFNTGCAAPDVIELDSFPILRDGSDFKAGKAPGADRVVLARKASGSRFVYQQCGLMTHDGAPGPNAFVKCN